MTNIELQLKESELQELKDVLKASQNIYTMEILKQIEEQEYLSSWKN